MELADIFKTRLSLIQEYTALALDNPSHHDHTIFAQLITDATQLLTRLRVSMQIHQNVKQIKAAIADRKRKVNKFMNTIYNQSYIAIPTFTPVQLTLEEIIKTSTNLAISTPPIQMGNGFLPKYIYYQPIEGINTCSLNYTLDTKKRMPKPKVIPNNETMSFTYVKPGQAIAIEVREITQEAKADAFIQYTLNENIPTCLIGTRYDFQSSKQLPITIDKDVVFTCVLCCRGYMDSKAVQIKYKVTAEGQVIEDANKNQNMLVLTQHHLGEVDIISYDMTPGYTPHRTPSHPPSTSITPMHPSIYTPVYDRNRKNSSASLMESP